MKLHMDSKKEESFKLELTEDQLKILSSQAKDLSKGKLVIEIYNKDTKIGQLRAAECAYYSDTCCA